MNSFLRIFLACLLALFVFGLIGFFIFASIIGNLGTPRQEQVGVNAVLEVDLSLPFPEVAVENPLAALTGEENSYLPSVYDVVRLIRTAAGDKNIKGIYLKCRSNGNGFGASEDIRNALLYFKRSNKFVYAYGEVITQGGYYVANMADKIYCNPQGGLDWRGYSMNLFFLKGLLDKLEIEPQIFYAGKFKSATEPFRATEMTPANRLQTTVLLNDLYDHFLAQTAVQRKLDTAVLRRYATESQVQTAADALKLGLVDGLRYEDELETELHSLLGTTKNSRINWVPLAKYTKAVSFRKTGKDKLALIYAQGDIVDGKGLHDLIGSESYVKLIRRARLDSSIRGIVFRINSGGGSALASENIWRELSLARAEKPVVISFGDVAASGGYYLSCNADSIFAQPNTITGSIGVFAVIPNLQKFFNNKLGISFDGVKTAPDADAPSVNKPLTPAQQRWIQAGIDSTYSIFLQRVAGGRSLHYDYVDSIAQGRVWSGSRAQQLGLIDRIGGLQEAIDCAARLAKVTDYRLREFPEPDNVLERILGINNQNARAALIRKDWGEEGVKTFQTLDKLKSLINSRQARIPFELIVE